MLENFDGRLESNILWGNVFICLLVVPSQNLPEDAILVEPMADFDPDQPDPVQNSPAETSSADAETFSEQQ